LKVLHKHFNRSAGIAFAVSPIVESLSSFNVKLLAFADVFGDGLRLFAGGGNVIPIGFLVSSPVAVLRLLLTAIEKLAIKVLLALMRVSGSRPKFPMIVTFADIIFIGSLYF